MLLLLLYCLPFSVLGLTEEWFMLLLLFCLPILS